VNAPFEAPRWPRAYCRRLPNPDDRRSSLVELTSEACRVLADAGRAFGEELHRWLGDAVPERTLRQLAATLGRPRSAGKQTGLEKTASPRPRQHTST
jgi:hypothetical protein